MALAKEIELLEKQQSQIWNMYIGTELAKKAVQFRTQTLVKLLF